MDEFKEKDWWKKSSVEETTLNEDDLDEIMSEADLDGDGKVYFEEFVKKING